MCLFALIMLAIFSYCEFAVIIFVYLPNLAFARTAHEQILVLGIRFCMIFIFIIRLNSLEGSAYFVKCKYTFIIKVTQICSFIVLFLVCRPMGHSYLLVLEYRTPYTRELYHGFELVYFKPLPDLLLEDYVQGTT